MVEKKRWKELVRPGQRHHLAIILFMPDRVTRYHTHDFPEVFWIERGVGLHRINGQEHLVRPGEVIFVRPEDEHVLATTDAKGFTLINLAYDPRLRAALLQRHAEKLTPILAPREPLPHRARFVPPSRRQLALLSADANSDLGIEHFLLGLGLQAQPSLPESHQGWPDWLQHACAQMQKPELLAQGVPGFVHAAGRSAEHVARATRKVLGVTPSDFINRVRMEHAARELRVTERAIADIALDCGLNNLSHFYALFRKAHGVTPRRYRQQQSLATV
jgi:AraC family cel operon transcriptional repressor